MFLLVFDYIICDLLYLYLCESTLWSLAWKSAIQIKRTYLFTYLPRLPAPHRQGESDLHQFQELIA